MPMQPRTQRYGVTGRSLRRWEVMTNWADDVIEEEAEEGEEFRSDGDVLGEVTGKVRRRIPQESSIPYEEKWETDKDAYQASKVRRIIVRYRSGVSHTCVGPTANDTFPPIRTDAFGLGQRYSTL